MALGGEVDGGASEEVSLRCRAWSLCALAKQPGANTSFFREAGQQQPRQPGTQPLEPSPGVGMPRQKPCPTTLPCMPAHCLALPEQAGLTKREQSASRGGPHRSGSLGRSVGNSRCCCPQTPPGHRHQQEPGAGGGVREPATGPHGGLGAGSQPQHRRGKQGQTTLGCGAVQPGGHLGSWVVQVERALDQGLLSEPVPSVWTLG